MNRTAVWFLTILLLACIHLAEAQQQKEHRIGLLHSVSSASVTARTNAFREGMRNLGYVEGQSVFIEVRYAEGKLDRLRALVAELVRLKVDAIVTSGPSPTRAAKEASITLPI